MTGGGGDGVTSLAAGPAERGWSGLADIAGIRPGATVSGAILPRLGPTGRVRIRNESGESHLTAALAGYFVGGAPLADDPTSCRLDAEPGFTPIYDGRSPQSRAWSLAAGTTGDSNCEMSATAEGRLRWYRAEHLPANFTLRMDWRATSDAADSGVFLGFAHPGDGATVGLPAVEVQIRPTGAGSNATGGLPGLNAPIADAERPVGQWNSYEIAVAGKRVTVRLNDVLVNDYVVTDDRLRPSAFLGVQGSPTDGIVRFRNIRVRSDLPATRRGVMKGVGGNCLDGWGWGITPGTPLWLYGDCHARFNQQVTMPGDGTLRIGGRCADASGPLNSHLRATVVLADCNDSAAQHFVHRPDRTLYHPASDTCVDSPGIPDLIHLHMHPCHGAPHQQFDLPTTRARTGLVTGVAGRCIDVTGGRPDNGTPLHLGDCHGGWNQVLTLPGDGTIWIGGKCLDSNGPPTGGPGDRAVHMWECNGTGAQQWVARPDGTLFNPITNRCLDSPGTHNGAVLYVHNLCHARPNQQWALPVLAPAGSLVPAASARLVASWPAEENTGVRLGDASGNGHTATLAAGASWAPARGGSALSLDGTGGHASASPAVLQTSRSFAVAAWVNPSRLDSSSTAVAQDGDQRSAFLLHHSVGHGWAFTVSTEPAGEGVVRAVARNLPAADRWTHLAGVYDSVNDQIRLYVDGSLAATAAVPKLWQATGPTTVGRARWGNRDGQYWPGKIDDVRLFQGMLSPSEVLALARG